MAKFFDDTVLDAPLDVVAACTRITVCSAQPANFAGIAAVKLAEVTVSGGDFTKANGDASGRKVTVGAKTGVSITANGSATHICYDNGTILRAGTTCTTQVLTSGGTLTIPSHKAEFADPT